MTNQVALFPNAAPLDLSSLPEEMRRRLMGVGSSLSSGVGVDRISIRGSRWRLISGGEEVAVNTNNELNFVIVGASNIARTYYEGTYNPQADAAPPACWSADGVLPAPTAGKPQHAQCQTCPQNVKGSDHRGTGRACRFMQRIAVALEGDLTKVWQMQIPAASLFGGVEGNHRPLHAYYKQLEQHQMPISTVMTTAYFDTAAESPKLYWRPARPLSSEELQQVFALLDSPDVDAATEVMFTGEAPAPTAAAAAAAPAGFTAPAAEAAPAATAAPAGFTAPAAEAAPAATAAPAGFTAPAATAAPAGFTAPAAEAAPAATAAPAGFTAPAAEAAPAAQTQAATAAPAGPDESKLASILAGWGKS